NLAERAPVGGVRLLWRRRRRGAFKRIQQLQREIVAACRELLDLVTERVVSDNGRNGGKQPGGGRDQRLRNAGRDRPQGSGAGGAQPLEGVNNAPHGAEQAD